MRFVVLVAFVLCAGSASAAEKLAVSPPAAWVRPIPLPTDVKADGAPIKLLLTDEQLDLQPGKLSRYSENAYRIQTPEGLNAGTVAFAWDPATQAVIVHKLQIRRGGQVIDVLGAGQTFTVVRRESNLENATIDGVLTATLQPEGLQVGDVIDFAATTVAADPAMGRHVEQLAGGWNVLPIARAHLRAQWLPSTPLRLRATGGLVLPKPLHKDGLVSIELSLDNVQPLSLPKGAPKRYQYGRLVEMSDFTSWADHARMFAPIYVKAATLSPGSALQGEIARIAATTADPVARAEAALTLVQNRIRYVALNLNDGGLIPADAETSWSRRFADCKGKTAVLLAMLHGLGIEADPAAVSVDLGDGLDQRLPMITPFDHVIVRAIIAGRTYWLDGTRSGDRRLADLSPPAFHWALVLSPNTSQLTALMPPPRSQPDSDVTVRIDATKGITLPAPMHVETVIRGDVAVATNLGLASQTPDVRDRSLRTYWKKHYDFVEVKKTDATFDADKRELTLTMDGDATMEWNDGWYQADGSGLGYKADFQRDPGPDRDAPYAVEYPFYSHSSETILLPPGGGKFTLSDKGTDVDQTVAELHYHRVSKITGNRFTVDATVQSLAPEFPAKDAPAAQLALRDLDKKDVYIGMPEVYLQTPEEMAILSAKTPTTAEEYIDRGATFLAHNDYDKALADFDKAVAMKPGYALALANRGLIRAQRRENEAATRDLDAALAIEPRQAVAWRGRGVVAQTLGKNDDAIADYTTSLQIDPGNSFAIGHRAEAEAAKGQVEAALADAAAALKDDPSWGALYLLRANLFRRTGKAELAQKEADTAAAAAPTNMYVLTMAAKIYASYGRRADAMAMFDRSLAVHPTALTYSNRAETRLKSDVAGRLADLDAAIKLDPEWAEPLIAKAELEVEQKHPAEAATALAGTTRLNTDDAIELGRRAIVYQQIGDRVHAQADFAAARKRATTASDLNGLCWQKATAGVELDVALAECDAALALTPGSAAVIDSRALVLLRMNRIEDAVGAYDKALAQYPDMPSSLYGRAVAEARKGDKQASDRDRAAALKVDPEVGHEFATYGVDIGQKSPSL